MKKYISQLDAAVIIFPKFSALYFALITLKWRFNQSKNIFGSKIDACYLVYLLLCYMYKNQCSKKFKKFIQSLKDFRFF